MAWVYIFLSMLSWPIYYYCVSHLLYSHNVYYKFSALLVTCALSLFHYDAFLTDRIAVFNIDTSDNDILHYSTIFFAYSYCVPFFIAYKKFYRKRS